MEKNSVHFLFPVPCSLSQRVISQIKADSYSDAIKHIHNFNFPRTSHPRSSLAEAKGFEQAKQKANGVHFIAVQSNPQEESFAGFWLLQEVNLP